jgi:monoamine oxidase
MGCGWLHSADENEWEGIARARGFEVFSGPPPWTRPGHTAGFPAEQQKLYRAETARFYDRLEAASNEDRNVADLLEPGGRWNAILGAMSTYINGVELEALTTREYDRYHDTGLNHRVVKGYGALVEDYAAGLDIRLDCPATLIDHSGKRVRIATPQGDIAARVVVVAVPPTIMANETLRFAPALPAKHAAADKLKLGVADKVFLRIDNPEDLPVDTRLFGSTTSIETGSYNLRAFDRPVIEGYFGGAFARALEAEGEGAFARVAIEEIAARLGNDMKKRLHPIVESGWARDPWSLGAYSYGQPGAAALRAALAAPVDDRLFFAGEHCSAADFSTAHGAYRTGVAAAREALAALA